MSDGKRLAEDARARLAEHKADLLACLRRAHREFMASRASDVVSSDSMPLIGWLAVAVGGAADLDIRQAVEQRRRWAEETAWGLIENEAMLWAADSAIRGQIKPTQKRRNQAEELADAACQTRKILRRVLQKRPNGFRSETAGELVAALCEADPEVAGLSDPIERHEYPYRRLLRLVDDLKAIEAAAEAVRDRHPPRTRGRQPGEGLLPTDRVRSLGWIFERLSGQEWRDREGGPFVAFVQAIAAAVGLPDDYDVREAIKRAHPDYVPSPSRTKERRRKSNSRKSNNGPITARNTTALS